MLAIDDIKTLTNKLQLNTQRLTLRRFISSDLNEELKAQQDPDVIRYIREPMSNEEAVKFFDTLLQPWQAQDGEWTGLCVVRRDDEQIVGAVSLRFEAQDFAIVEIGYRFNPLFQGNGYAFEAVKTLVTFLIEHIEVHKIVARCDPLNVPSFKLMEKLGMQREGLLRQHFKIGEQYSDELIYGLLASEWPNNN